MKARILFLTLLFIALHSSATVFGYDEDIGKAAQTHAKPLETFLIDGPFHVGGRPYYTVEYLYIGEERDTLVYGAAEKEFIADRELIRKVFTTRDLALVTLLDPLLYAPGDYSSIALAAQYETQNVRNFADFVPMTLNDRTHLERFLQSYERLAVDIGEINRITNNILYPESGLIFSFTETQTLVTIGSDEDLKRDFSYELFQELLSAYAQVSEDYDRTVDELMRLSSGFEDFQVETPVREKWGVIITTENIKEQIELVGENSKALSLEIGIREGIMSSDYNEKLDSLERMEVSGSSNRGYLLIIPLFLLGVYYLFRNKKRPPAAVVLLLLLIPVSQAAVASLEIPTPSELLSLKVKNTESIDLKVFAENLDSVKAMRVLSGYPLLLEGERAEVRGPYYINHTPYYLYEIFSGEMHTGNGFLVDANTELIEPNQQRVYQAIKARRVSELIASRTLYNADANFIEAKSLNASLPLDMFLTNLSINIREGAEIEKELVLSPNFEDVAQLAGDYTEAFALLTNIGHLLPEEEAMEVTGGMYAQRNTFEAYSRVVRGITAEEFLAGRKAMYRARTLNRLPVIAEVSSIGMQPSLPQLIQDLTSDLIYDNYFLWRLGRSMSPNLFVRLPFKEGFVTYPSMVNASQNFSLPTPTP